MPDRVAAGCRHRTVACMGGRVGGSGVVHVTAEQRERRPTATAFHLDYIDLPADIVISSAATHTQAVMHRVGIFFVGEVYRKGDLLR